jgi:5-methylcytosine-specific restriction protein A
MKKKICNYPGCNTLISQDQRYCDNHSNIKKAVPFQNAIRSNEGLYNTHKWRQLRKEVLKEQPNCYYCGITKDEAALDIHHIIPPRGNEDLFFDIHNLIAVCKQCHRVITAKEINKRSVY